MKEQVHLPQGDDSEKGKIESSSSPHPLDRPNLPLGLSKPKKKQERMLLGYYCSCGYVEEIPKWCRRTPMYSDDSEAEAFKTALADKDTEFRKMKGY